jgi:hypothetical protein
MEVENESAERFGVRMEASGESRLTSLPPEIIELIAFYCATVEIFHHSDTEIDPLQERERYATPPSGLRSLLLTSNRLYLLLNSASNPGLYAQIFRSKFDTAAIARRFGPAAVSAKSLTRELQKRCICLKRIRRAVSVGRLYPEGKSKESVVEMEECLWLAFMMMMENGEAFSMNARMPIVY